ncbi:MAG TPA: SoxR reducing system RseC family protein [Methylomusa anaerophila]|uniref:SoxR reducing system protein RseC n=1 Tax=Methylomusa anaerophila TaxID=1930071 RepID=A0A348AFB8_9FIRM|nr:SoxR reducing system RseC family protein [Methylomusa anaerophila]BBB89766.1 SoxR reducing system protein RseC [Methylomusa anaerophila]HML89188.1 SoxR reducing system RseC family protein [Methylomusa anaerophila]
MDKQQEGIVLEIIGDMAKVRTSRHSDCENCGACPGNTALVLDARNPLGAKKGQRVAIEVQEANMLKAAFVVYVLPLILTVIGVVAGSYIGGQFHFDPLWFQIGGGAIAFIAALFYIKYFDRNARSNVKMQPVITRILSE